MFGGFAEFVQVADLYNCMSLVWVLYGVAKRCLAEDWGWKKV